MVLDSGRCVLVGINEHTEERGFRKLAEALAGIETVPVPHETVHLDCCLAPLPNGDALYASALLPDSSVSKVAMHFSELTALDADEAASHLAANILWLDSQRVVCPVATKKTNALLREKGYEAIELDFSDLISQLGSFRCVVCPIERD